MIYYVYQLVKIIFLLILPFLLLIRGSVHLLVEYKLDAYTSLLGGAGITVIALVIYFSFFYGRMIGKLGSYDSMKRRTWIAILMVLAYSIHGIFFFSSSNAKSNEVRSELLDLHPILRLSLSTLIHFDKELIVTDASRKVSDYDGMGLKRNSRSKHLKQSDGYAHAIDLRTKGRPEFKNQMMAMYFRAMGMETLRHVGTDDHLHVAMPNH